MRSLTRGIVGVSLVAAVSAACHSSRTVQPGAPGSATQVVPPARSAALAATDADVAFMQGMIGHHAQAIQMVALLKTHTSNKDMQLLGLRIEVSQNDEIKMMQTWLRNYGATVPDAGGHMMHGAPMPGMDMAMPPTMMPGMLTPEQMTQLGAANDNEFDRLFLEFMIQHHEGALTMVKALVASPGAGQDSSINAFATDVVADQSAEINRMRGMRARMGKHT